MIASVYVARLVLLIEPPESSLWFQVLSSCQLVFGRNLTSHGTRLFQALGERGPQSVLVFCVYDRRDATGVTRALLSFMFEFGLGHLWASVSCTITVESGH